ncbi:MAG: aminopeptidase P family protein [Clostridia bacterium]|nr:aminopeptidase P family protein [Clostridia bacterium]
MKRAEQLLGLLKEQELDSLFLNNVQNIRYISGYTGEDSYILISPKGKWFITDYRYSEQAEEECKGFKVICRNRQEVSLGQCVNQILKENGLVKMGFERDHINFGMIEDIRADIEGVEVVPTSGLVESIRYVKDEEEVALMKKAASIADQAFEKLMTVIEVGMTEAEAVIELEYYLRQLGADGVAFDTILLAGARTSMPHGIPSDKVIEKGDFITIDFGALYKGYRSDMTRTFVMGEASEEQIRLYNSVLEAQKIGVAAVKSGISGKEPDDRVKEILERDNYYEYAGKGLGHGVGLNIHERPFLSQICTDELKENGVITIEPGVYIPGFGGVRVEDTVIITKDGCEIITRTPKELLIIK